MNKIIIIVVTVDTVIINFEVLTGMLLMDIGTMVVGTEVSTGVAMGTVVVGTEVSIGVAIGTVVVGTEVSTGVAIGTVVICTEVSTGNTSQKQKVKLLLTH